MSEPIPPKQWLLDNGHIDTIGRGRLSAAHIDLIKNAVASGVAIKGYSSDSTGGVVKSEKPLTIAKSAKPKTEFTGIADVGPELRPESKWTAFSYHEKKREIGMRTVCNTCHNSLTYCGCKVPLVNLSHDVIGAVTFAPRNG